MAIGVPIVVLLFLYLMAQFYFSSVRGFAVAEGSTDLVHRELERLTRDELQAVIGHEFSHILNGDMRLNVRMLGVLAGIVFLGSIGEFVMRSVRGTKEKEALALRSGPLPAIAHRAAA